MILFVRVRNPHQVLTNKPKIFCEKSAGLFLSLKSARRSPTSQLRIINFQSDFTAGRNNSSFFNSTVRQGERYHSVSQGITKSRIEKRSCKLSQSIWFLAKMNFQQTFLLKKSFSRVTASEHRLFLTKLNC